MNNGLYARSSGVENMKQGGDLERRIVITRRSLNSNSACPFLLGYSYSYGYSFPFGSYQNNKLYSLIFLLERESNERGQMKWCAWSKIYIPVEEGGAGTKDLSDVKKSFHMKFVWRLMTIDNIWSILFKAKYVKSSHLATSNPTPIGSQFWKAVLKVFPKFY